MIYLAVSLALILGPGILARRCGWIWSLVRRRRGHSEVTGVDLRQAAREIRAAYRLIAIAEIVAVLVFGVALLVPDMYFDRPVDFVVMLLLVVVAVRISNLGPTLAATRQVRVMRHISSVLDPRSGLSILGSEGNVDAIRRDIRIGLLATIIALWLLSQGVVAIFLKETGLLVGYQTSGIRTIDIGVDWRLSAPVLICAAWAVEVWSARRERRQRLRRLAESYDPESPTVLFLRSFGDERQKVPKRSALFELPRERYIVPRIWETLDLVLLRLLWPTGSVTMVTEPGGMNMNGAGALGLRLDPLNAWEQQVQRLMNRAQMIVLVLGERRGIRTELAMVEGDPELARKTVVVVSPAIREAIASGRLETGLIDDKELLTEAYLLGFLFEGGGWTPVWSDDTADIDYSLLIDEGLRRTDLEYPSQDLVEIGQRRDVRRSGTPRDH